MVFKPNQIHTLHYLAQLQMDHFENSFMDHVGGFSRAILLRFTWLHYQTNVRSLGKKMSNTLRKYYIEEKSILFQEKRKFPLYI